MISVLLYPLVGIRIAARVGAASSEASLAGVETGEY
jgi:hypothetical protein